MGEHAAGDRSFAASLLRAAAGGLVALVVTFGVTGALTVLGRDDGSGGPAIVAQPSEAASRATASPASQAASERPADPASPSPAATARQKKPKPGRPARRDRVGPDGTVTVQVLDAVGTGTQAQEAAAVLRDRGYEVVVVNPTPQRVDTTTVLATQGHRDDARDLRDADPRFGVIKPNTAFNEAVDLHVLVGPDFSP